MSHLNSTKDFNAPYVLLFLCSTLVFTVWIMYSLIEITTKNRLLSAMLLKLDEEEHNTY